MSYFEELYKKQEELFLNIKNNITFLEELLIKYQDHWNYEDMIYRFYHQSFKCYYIQSITKNIVTVLKSLAPKDTKFNNFFEEIFTEGTGKKFSTDDNQNWTQVTRPIIEAFFMLSSF